MRVREHDYPHAPILPPAALVAVKAGAMLAELLMAAPGPK
jgi:hypothetical protein